MATPNASYPSSSDTNSTASAPTGDANDKGRADASPGVQHSPDNGSAPPVAPRAASNADMVNKHQTSCSGDSVLVSTIGNAMKMHDEGASFSK